MSDKSQPTEPSPIVDALQAELKAMRPGIVDLECRLKFIQGRRRLGEERARSLRALIAVYEGEADAKQS